MASESKLDTAETLIDFPPESFWVSRDDEQDWLDRNAVMQRKTSFKFGFNRSFNSFSHQSEITSNRKNRGASVFGLPKAQDKKPSKFLFRTRSEPGVKSTVQVTEPGSPRVSCTGKVGFKNREERKTGFSKLFSSLFRTRSRKYPSRKIQSGIVCQTGDQMSPARPV